MERSRPNREWVDSRPEWGGFMTMGPWTRTGQLVIPRTMSTMSLAEAKAHLSEVVNRVSTQRERVTVTVHGRASAVLLAPDDLE